MKFIDPKSCKILNDKSGSILIVVLLIMGIMTLVVVSLSSMITQSLKASKSQEFSILAYFAAETGLERVLWEVTENGFDTTGCVSGQCIDFENGICSDNCNENGKTMIILDIPNNVYYQVRFTTTNVNGYDETVYQSTGSKGSEVSRMIRASY